MLMFASGSVDEQCNSPFPREQEQQLVSGIALVKGSGSFIGTGLSSKAVFPDSAALWS